MDPIDLDIKDIDLFIALAAVAGATAKMTDKGAFKGHLAEFAAFYEKEGNLPSAKTIRALMETIKV